MNIARHRGLIGYLLLIGVSVVAVELHHLKTTGDIKDNAQETCVVLEEITENQEFVLGTLTVIIAEQSSINHAPDLIPRLDALDKRLRSLPKFDCSHGLKRVP